MAAGTKTTVSVDWSTWYKFGFTQGPDGTWLLDLGPIKIDNTAG